MKKSILYVLLVSFLIGCSSNSSVITSGTTSGNVSNTTQEIMPSNNTSVLTPSLTSQNTTTIIPTTSLSNSTTTVVVTPTYNTIASIKEKAKEFVGKENKYGVYESNVSVSLNLKLLANLDAITTKDGYGDRYKILMSDGKDYIYLKTNYENYDYLEKYVTDQGVYSVKGTISLYNGEVEIAVSEKPTYLKDQNIELDYDSLAKEQTLSEVYESISSLKLNVKGIAFSKIVKVKVKCLAKDINNTNMYFGNGDYIINVHGHDKITNGFTAGNSYVLYGAIQMHNFRPGLECVGHESLSTPVEFNTDSLDSKTAAEFYNYKYETDEDATYPKYSALFYHPYKITGYVNVYLKDNKQYVVFEDKFNTNYYSKYQNAADAKAVFFVNENYIKLTESNAHYCPLYEHFGLESKLEITIFPYLWNTQKYPQVYCYDFRVIE